MKTGISWVLILLLIGVGCTPQPQSPYLKEALKIDRWLQTQYHPSDTSLWLDETTGSPADLSWGTGIAGILAFYLELYKITQDSTHYNILLEGSQYLLRKLPKTVEQADMFRHACSRFGVITGSADFLLEAFHLTGDESYREGVNHCLSLIDSLSTKPDGRYWNTFDDIIRGGAGTGLFLLKHYQETGDKHSLQMAVEAAITIERRAIQNGDSIYWLFHPQRSFSLPNFSHGAAGIGYFYATLYEATNDQQYLDLARKIAAYLDLIAWEPDGAYLLPYGIPDMDWDRPYDIGWAHGPAGTGRFFLKLWEVTGDDQWKQRALACYQGIQLSGAPGLPQENFGSEPFPVDRRFGLGGVVEYGLELVQHDLIASEDLFLITVFDSLDFRSYSDAQVKYWTIPRYPFMTESEMETSTFTGYFYGAAGLGQVYVRRYQLDNK